MHTSMLTHATGIAFVATMLVLTSELASAKLPIPTGEQKARADLVKAKVVWDDKVAAFQTCEAQDKATASYQAGGKAVHMRPGVPCIDPGPFVAPMLAASTPVPAAKGQIVGPNVACSSSDSTVVCSLSEP